MATLIVLNIPVYLLVGWLVFDTTEDAVDTFFDTIVAILKAILIPRIVRVLTGDDVDGAWGIVPVAVFLFTCVGIVYGEYYLIVECLS